MSCDLYHTRLYFDADHGTAKSGDVQVALHSCPDIDGLPKHLRMIDFAPEVRCFDLRESAHGRREMTRDEIAAASSWLKRMEESALRAMQP